MILKKTAPKILLLLGVWLLLASHVSALPITVDTGRVTGTWSEEWNLPGNLDGWSTSQTSGSVQASGTDTVFMGVASGTDAQVSGTNFANGPDLDLGFNDFIELRIKVPDNYSGDIQIYYGTTPYVVSTWGNAITTGTAQTTGFSSSRVITIPASSIKHDGAFHIYRIDAGLEPAWRSTLRDLRIDPLVGPGTSGMSFAIDYIRIGDDPNATVYQPRITTACPADGGLVNNQTVSSMESKHFRVLWTGSAASSPYWSANTPHGTLRNLEEAWQVYVKKLGYSEPCQDTVSKSGPKYKTNLTTWNPGYNCGIDDYNGTKLALLNITPDGLVVDPPTLVIPHEFRHAIQYHNTLGNVTGDWWEFDANYGRERWLQHYGALLYPNFSGIDPTYLRCAHQIIGAGRDYYLSWPFLLYLDENPDGLPDLGEGTVRKLWQQTQTGEFAMMALDRLTPTTSLKDIVGGFARRGATYNYASKAAIQASLALFGIPLDNAATARWQFTDLVQRSDDPNWWQVPFEMAPMQGAYAIHELAVSGSGTPGRVVSVNFHGLADSTRGADWRASFIVIADNGAERYSSVWGNGTNSVTLSGSENKLYLSVAGAPDVFYQGGQDDSVYPYRSDASKARFPYEIQVTGATPKQRDNGGITGLTQHSNGGGYKANTASVDSTAYIGPNARVLGSGIVTGSARIDDFAVVQDSAQISGNAQITGHALVRGNAVVTDNAKVRDWALVESGTISLNGRVLEHANIKGGLVTDISTAKGSAGSLTGTLSGNAIIDGDYGDFFYGRNVSNGIGFGHKPYEGVPDNWIRPLPSGLFASYDFASAHDSRILDQYGVTDGFTAGSPVWVAADAKRKGFLTFDGTTQYVRLDRSIADLHDFSFTAWVRPLGGTANQALLWLGASTTQRLCFTPDDGTGHAKFSICNGGADQSVSTPAALPLGTWSHVAITLNGSTGTVYLNGNQVASGAITIRPDQLLAPNTATGGQQNYLARSQGSAMPMFYGALDDVQFYGKVLSSAEVGAFQPLSSSGTLYVDLRATDSSAGKPTWVNSGTLGSFTRTGSVSKVANVLSTGIPGVLFDGTSSAYTGPSSVADIDGSGDRSIEVWALNPSLGDEETTVSWGYRGTPDSDIAFNFGSNGTWGAATHWGANDTSWGAAPPSAGVWHHLVYTYDGATTVKVYIDGSLANTKTLSGTLSTFPNQPINIGCQRDSATGGLSHFYGGYLNAVRVYGGVLSATQVAANYSSGPFGAPANVAPTLSAITDKTFDYGTTNSISLTVGDIDTPLSSLALSCTSSNPSSISPASVSFSGTGSARTMTISATSLSGTAALTVIVSDGSSTSSRTFNVTILNQGDTWRRKYFGTTSNTGSAADSADPDGDGISNLLERAFGGNPNAPDPNLRPIVDNTAPLLSILYWQSDAASDLVYTVQECSDLSANLWTPASGTSTVLSDDGSVRRIRFTAPASASRHFLRLQVTKP